MTTYNVTLSSRLANTTILGTEVTADTERLAQKAANKQAVDLSHVDHLHAWDWTATITPAA